MGLFVCLLQQIWAGIRADFISHPRLVCVIQDSSCDSLKIALVGDGLGDVILYENTNKILHWYTDYFPLEE